jgi:hypothetical protein
VHDQWQTNTYGKWIEPNYSGTNEVHIHTHEQNSKNQFSVFRGSENVWIPLNTEIRCFQNHDTFSFYT